MENAGKTNTDFTFQNGDVLLSPFIIEGYARYWIYKPVGSCSEEQERICSDIRQHTIKIVESIVLHNKIYYVEAGGNLFTHWLDHSGLSVIGKITEPFPDLPSSFFGELLIKTGAMMVDENNKLVGNPEYVGSIRDVASHVVMLLSNHYGLTYTSDESSEKQPTSNYKKYQNKALRLTSQEAKIQIRKYNDWIQSNYFSLDTPLIFDYVVQKATTHQDIIKTAIDLRNSKEAVMFRKMSMAFEQALKAEDNNNLVFIIDEMENAISLLSKKMSSPRAIPIDISFPLGFSIDTDKVLDNLGLAKKHHLEFITRLYQSAVRSRETIAKFYELII